MRRIQDPFLRDVVKWTLKLVGVLVLMKLTHGIFAAVLMAMGIVYAITNRSAKAIVIYILYPFLAILNGIICPHMPMFSAITRIGTAVMALAMILSASRRTGREQLPLAGMFLYIVVALISSMSGYFPLISYLKLINFSIFLLGLYLGVKNIHNRPEELAQLRSFCMAVACVLIFGSLCTLAVPAIGYSTSVARVYSDVGEVGAEEIIRNLAAKQGMLLFAGITNQSQSLAPLLSCVLALVVCDMIIAENRVTKLHAALILCTLPLMYKTRSRVAIMSLFVLVVLVYIFVMHRAKMATRLKRKITSSLILGLGLILVFGVVSEAQSGAISKWLRKTNDTEMDTRSMGEALTASRMGAFEELSRDFKRNPMWGTGFQVTEVHPILYQLGYISIFSAPCEKGLLPMIVLGETGVMGAIAFLIFLGLFYGTCKARRYIATATVFTVFLATNMGEGTFFSPSGTGGILWIISVVGGFIVDMYAKYYRDQRGQISWGGVPS